MLEVKNMVKTFFKGTINEKTALQGINLRLEEGDFCTVIGGNGAGKSTLLNSIAGVFPVDEGSITINEIDVTKMPEYKRAKYIGRVFQDPMVGTAGNMQIEENLILAMRRGKRLGLKWAFKDSEQAFFKERLALLGLGLEDRLSARMGLLSGGQRQSITLLMATMLRPELLLLDEHTAALDPKTAENVLQLTDKLVAEHNLTTLMITHNMEHAIEYGNRLVMLYHGKIVVDVRGKEKKNLTVAELMDLFHKNSGQVLNDDALVLG
jgi:putative ABC transport system ATP-binding protein